MVWFNSDHDVVKKSRRMPIKVLNLAYAPNQEFASFELFHFVINDYCNLLNLKKDLIVIFSQ